MIYIHVLDEFSLAGGGVRSVVADVADEMAKRGLKVYICPLGIPKDKSKEEYIKWGEKRGVSFCLLRGQKENLLKASIKLHSILKKLSISDNCCLYLHLKRGVLSGILASLGMNKIRRVEVFHSNYINYRLQAFFCRPFLDKYLPVSKESEEQLISNYGVKSSKISLAYNGINIEKIRNYVTPIKRDISIFRILSVGRMSPQKNLETSISAFCEFSESKDYVSSEYLIAGDGPQRSEFEKLANGKVSFLGMIERNQVCSNIAAADVILFPSLWEGHSIALLEVLAIGCPVIVTDIPAFREVLGNKPLLDDELFRPTPFGALFHKGNKESCKAAINYMAHNKGNTDSMRQFVLSLADNYTVSKQVDVYIEAAQK